MTELKVPWTADVRVRLDHQGVPGEKACRGKWVTRDEDSHQTRTGLTPGEGRKHGRLRRKSLRIECNSKEVLA